MAKTGRIYDTTTWIIAITLVLGFVAGFLVARVKYRTQIGLVSTMVMDKASEIDTLKAENNRNMMVGGTMMEERGGVVNKMSEDIILSNGSRITMSGKMITKDGTTITLKDGESIMMNGTMNGMMGGQ